MRKSSNPVLFIRVGWIDWYDDRRDPEPPRGGGSYNEENVGSEMNNHRPIAGWCYGYVQTGSRTLGLNLQRRGASRDAEQVEGVTIIEVATQPGGGQVVVGWFKDATCLAEYDDRPRRIRGIYNFWARQHDTGVLPLEHRTIPVPKGRGALGQSNVCYADAKAAWVRRIVSALDMHDADAAPATRVRVRVRTRRRGQGPLLDVLKRLEIERYAMERAARYFEQRGYTVKDISRAESIDLRCRRGRELLHVEVKGTQGNARGVVLSFTRNEIDLANDPRIKTALFLVHGIEMKRLKAGWEALSGSDLCVTGWRPVKSRLVPTQYCYTFDVKRGS